MDTGSTSTDNLIESLTNTLALLNQSFKAHLPQINNQLRTSSNARNKATVQDDRVVVQDVRDRYNVNNQGRPFQRNNARGNVVAGNVGGQNRVGNMNPGQAKPIMCYNCKGIGHIARESVVVSAENRSPIFDEEEKDLALNVDHIFEADQCDAFDSDVQDHDTFVDHMDEYHEVHEMQIDVQHNYVVDSDADYNEDSNIFRRQYVERQRRTYSEDTRDMARILRKRMLEKMKSPQCVENKVRISPPDYSKENLLATFAPQRNLTPEQIFLVP
ncbi:hypothetical protein Tco_1117577 [Tanacetum coccineum]